MRHYREPEDSAQPKLLADEEYGWWAMRLAPAALKRLEQGWHGIFRQSILKLMPVAELAKGFSKDQGRPSKELYAMAGLMLLAEFHQWTGEQTADAYCFDASVQYALNLGRDHQYVSARTIDNFRKRFREEELAAAIFAEVSATLIKELELNISRQRLDSTHVLSNMARFSRQQLLAAGTRRFLVQLQKRHEKKYEQLPEDLRKRYQPAESRLFGLGTKKPVSKEQAIEHLGQDMALLVERFGTDEVVGALKAFGALRRLFEEHFEVVEPSQPKVKLRHHSVNAQGKSAATLQNPSDIDAGYNGHKGAGYQAQIAQTLPPKDDKGKREGPGLITALVPQSAAVRDNEALAEVLEQQSQKALLAQEMSADTIYGSDANVSLCQQQGTVLISPVCGSPQGAQPSECKPAKKVRELRERLNARRTEQQTEEWKQKYCARSGIEGLHRALDVVTGFKRLSVRGLAAVSHALYLKAAGWNIKAAVQIKARRRARKGALRLRGHHRTQASYRTRKNITLNRCQERNNRLSYSTNYQIISSWSC